MKLVTRVQTYDGVLHLSERDAVRHVDNQYGLVLCGMAKQLCNLSKYTEMCQYIDDNLQKFVELAKIKADLQLDKADDDDDNDDDGEG